MDFNDLNNPLNPASPLNLNSPMNPLSPMHPLHPLNPANIASTQQDNRHAQCGPGSPSENDVVIGVFCVGLVILSVAIAAYVAWKGDKQ